MIMKIDTHRHVIEREKFWKMQALICGLTRQPWHGLTHLYHLEFWEMHLCKPLNWLPMNMVGSVPI